MNNTENTDGVDGCDCDEILFDLKDIEKSYDIFENKLDGVIKIPIADN